MVGTGGYFGDTSQLKERNDPKPQWVISVSNPLKCLMLQHDAITKLMNQCVTPDNLTLLKSGPETQEYNCKLL